MDFTTKISKRKYFLIYISLVCLISFFTYFKFYDYPNGIFWDENYHIPSSEKYLQNTFFMELHPPLGKLFIALGEKIINPNQKINKKPMVSVDYIKSTPTGYSYLGVRFFPTLFSFLSAFLFFLILFEIYPNPHLAFIFSSLYLFENANIVHSRGAMLDSGQLFFVFLSILIFLKILKNKTNDYISYLVLGVSLGLVISFKLSGVFILIIPVLLFLLKKEKIFKIFSSYLIAGFVFCLIFYLHFIIATNPINNNYYGASPDYIKILKEQKTTDIANFPIMLWDNLFYSINYNKGVPKYDPTKPDENGSLPYMWPFGNKSINYRSEKNNTEAKYLYLQCNPIIWLIGLTSIIFGSIFLLKGFNKKNKNNLLFQVIFSFLLLYYIYMGFMFSISRVMYLYHYFIPLFLSLLLSYGLFIYIFEKKIRQNNQTIYVFLLVIFNLIIWSYYFFSPLTYFIPLTREEFSLRNWFWFWKLKPV